MPRLKHIRTGVVVSVSDETAARLGHDWAPEGAPDAPSTQTQQRKLSKLLETAGHAERDAKYAYLAGQLGREISAWKDVTGAEADAQILALETAANDPGGEGQ